jgi:hypothetical protein
VLYDCIGAIKIWSKFLTVVCFERFFYYMVVFKETIDIIWKNDIHTDPGYIFSSFDFDPWPKYL